MLCGLHADNAYAHLPTRNHYTASTVNGDPDIGCYTAANCRSRFFGVNRNDNCCTTVGINQNTLVLHVVEINRDVIPRLVRCIRNIKAAHEYCGRCSAICDRINTARICWPIRQGIRTWVATRQRDARVQAVRNNTQYGGDRESNQRAAVAMARLFHEYQQRRYYSRRTSTCRSAGRPGALPARRRDFTQISQNCPALRIHGLEGQQMRLLPCRRINIAVGAEGLEPPTC